MHLSTIDLGRIPFKTAFHKQVQVHRQVLSAESSHTLILCEHPHTITLGRMTRQSNILDYNSIKDKNIDFIMGVNRGGDITYHGPGQLMGYLIFDLRRMGRSLGWFLDRIQEVLIRSLDSFGIQAGSREGFRGAWVGEDKIASIGIGVQKWVSLHGFALNVNTDLDFFKMIRPCGLDVKMTSMEKELGYYVNINKVKERVVEEVAKFTPCFSTGDMKMIPQVETCGANNEGR